MEFSIPGARSLKDKRRAFRSLKERLRAKYNCSVAEVGLKEKWGRGQIAVCVISDDAAHVSRQLEEIVRAASSHHLAALEHYETETL